MVIANPLPLLGGLIGGGPIEVPRDLLLETLGFPHPIDILVVAVLDY